MTGWAPQAGRGPPSPGGGLQAIDVTNIVVMASQSVNRCVSNLDVEGEGRTAFSRPPRHQMPDMRRRPRPPRPTRSSRPGGHDYEFTHTACEATTHGYG